MDLSQTLESLAALPEWEWPEGAHAVIREGMRSGQPEDRLLSVQLAGRDLDQVIAADLLILLQDDPDDDVRGEAALAFGPALEECSTEAAYFGFDDETALDAEQYRTVRRVLEAIYRSPNVGRKARRMALEAAVRAPAPWVAGATRAAFRSGESAWRTTAVFCMGHLDGFDAEILEALDDADIAVRREAIRAAGRAGVLQAGPEIMSLAASPSIDRSLRLAAIESLAFIDSPAAGDLLDMLSGLSDREIAEQAAWSNEQRDLLSLGDDFDDDF